MSSDSENGIRISRREALLFSAAAGMGIALAKDAHASDSTKTAAHQEPGNCSTPRSASREHAVRQGARFSRWRGVHVQGHSLRPGHGRRESLASGQASQALERRVSRADLRRQLPAEPPSPGRPSSRSFIQDWDDGYQSEDMLKLNVWTPSLTGKRAVMVYFHGGGFSFGSSYELPSQEGAQMARHHDVVSGHGQSPPQHARLLRRVRDRRSAYDDSVNVGMTDLVASLQWVRDNIANFGGDPDRVMIYGQSGGGSKVTTLMGMPSAAGLFHRAVGAIGRRRQHPHQRAAARGRPASDEGTWAAAE